MSNGNANPIKDAITRPEINLFLSIAVPLIGLAVVWGSLTTRVEHVERDLEIVKETQARHIIETENRFDEVDSVFLDIQVSLAQIKKDIEFIKLNLEKGGASN